MCIGAELPHLLLYAGWPVQGTQGPSPPKGCNPLQIPHRGRFIIINKYISQGPRGSRQKNILAVFSGNVRLEYASLFCKYVHI